MVIGITAIGTAVPIYKRNQEEVPALLAEALALTSVEKRMLKAVYKGSGIETRYSVLSDYCRTPQEFDFFPNDPQANFPSTAERMTVYKNNALPLALQAIQDCLAVNQTDINLITHVITVSCTGMYAPGLDIEIVQQLNLHPSTKRTAINFMGCYGAFNAIKVADAICRADSHALVLIVCVELCTIHFQKEMKLDNIISNAIFSDGAAAALIQAQPKQKKYLSLDAFYCDLVSQSSQAMAWKIADSGFDITLSAYVPDVIESGIQAFTKNLLKQLPLSAIDFYAIHPGGVKILEACEKALNISKEQNKYSYDVLKYYGNMSSATILFVLKKLLAEVNFKDNHKTIFSCAFGPGLTLESMLLKVQST